MDDHHHHHHHRPHRISIPPRSDSLTTAATSRPSYPVFAHPPPTPTPTPSKHRLSSLSTLNNSPNKRNSLSFLFLLLFSLRSLYSLLPFLRSSPSSFSIFPFAFLVSLLSFLLTLSFSLLTPSSSSKDPFLQKQHQPIFSLNLVTQSQHRVIVAKSLLLAFVFLLRFQALLYCGTAAMILAELSGNVAARFVVESRNRSSGSRDRIGSSKGHNMARSSQEQPQPNSQPISQVTQEFSGGNDSRGETTKTVNIRGNGSGTVKKGTYKGTSKNT